MRFRFFSLSSSLKNAGAELGVPVIGEDGFGVRHVLGAFPSDEEGMLLKVGEVGNFWEGDVTDVVGGS